MKTHLIPASSRSTSSQGRTLLAAIFLASSGFLVACSEPTNPAADYLTTADTSSATDTTDSTDTTDTTDTTTEEGNATTGAALIQSKCSSCHGTTSSTGKLSSQKLNASAVSKLEGAPTTQPSYHSTLTDNFTGQNLLDLKAACAAVP